MSILMTLALAGGALFALTVPGRIIAEVQHRRFKRDAAAILAAPATPAERT